MTKKLERGGCVWPGTDALYLDYHDTEWGVPERDGRALWEKLILDGFQAGLSWITILRKRENFRRAFKGFDPEKVARMTEKDVERLLKDEGIIRHRGKIEGAIKNARAYLDIEKSYPGGFAAYCWSWVGGKAQVNSFTTMKQVPAATDVSTAFSKDLKKRGFTFCGPTIVYAWMQACGLVNDHMTNCFRHKQVARAKRPGA
jgi:DNA-3-methyladenine glycosylase I